jgi:hypothetical protein
MIAALPYCTSIPTYKKARNIEFVGYKPAFLDTGSKQCKGRNTLYKLGYLLVNYILYKGLLL